MELKKTLFLLLMVHIQSMLPVLKKIRLRIPSIPIHTEKQYKCLVTAYSSESLQARKRMEQAYLDMVQNAHKNKQKILRILMFMGTFNKFFGEVSLAKARGVDVKVILDQRTGQAMPKVIRFLKKHKIPVDQYRDPAGGMMHAKIVTDGRKTISGSTNATRCAFEKHIEYAELNKNVALAQKKLKYFDYVAWIIEKQKKAARSSTRSSREWDSFEEEHNEKLDELKRRGS
jgi:phosphatidylserine/phosphatidylglycerophosphate/cardiolipin synthase-like enzyme